MEKSKNGAKILLCVSLALMLLCGIVVSAVQTSGGQVTMKELNIETDEGYSMSAYLFIPATATADSPAPAVVTSHGYLNNKEMSDANYVELARRGYVVLAVDQPNHGDSEVTAGFFILQPSGVYQGVLALSRMPFVDAKKIGVTGHSMGAWSVNAAIAQDNAADTQLIAAALLNCNDPVYTDADGNFSDPYGSRPTGVISAVYDEFFGTSTDENGGLRSSPYFMETACAQSFLYFGADPAQLEPRAAYSYYTDTVDGAETFRVIYRPEIIHPWSHFSARSESYVIDFFEKALGAPNPIASNNQVWQWKEAFNFVGVIGLVLFICSFGALLLNTRTFESLRACEPVQPQKLTDKKAKLWFWLSLIAGAAFCSLVYLSLLAAGNAMPVSQTETMGLGLWSTACGLFTIFSMVVYYFAYGKKNGMDLKALGVKLSAKKLGLSVLLGVIVAAVGYALVFVEDYFFMADFRLWTLAFKAFEAPILKYCPYMLLFIVYYVAISVATNCFNYNSIGGKLNGVICAIFAAFPALIIPWIQYITYFSAKHMAWPQLNMASPNYPMFVLWLFPLVLILFGTTLITRYFYKRTKNPYIAGVINALLVGLITIINTCTTVV